MRAVGLPASISTFVFAVALAQVQVGCCAEEEERIDALMKLNDSVNAKNAALTAEVAQKERLAAELAKTESELRSSRQQLERSEADAETAKEQQETLKGLLDSLKKMIESGDLEVRIRRGRMVIALPSEVLFASGEAELSEKGQETLASVVAVFKGIEARDFQVAGHTDNVPLGKDNPHASNWHLSAARAVAVVQFMVKKGMDPRRLSAAGYAHYQPAASNKTAKGKAKNRRIEITLMPNLKELPDLSELETAFGLAEPPPDEGY